MSKKGSSWEREVAKKLSLWWTDGENDAVFWRTSNSGGRATVRGKGGKSTRHQHGDLTATDPIGEPFIKCFTTELKRGYQKDTIHDILDKPNGAALQTYEKWFHKLNETSKRAGSLSWLLITRRDRRVPLVFYPSHTFSGRVMLIAHDLYLPTVATGDYCGVQITTLDRFLGAITPEQVTRMVEK